jgi:hypothetical protein
MNDPMTNAMTNAADMTSDADRRGVIRPVLGAPAGGGFSA